jgi:hypothetical protein
MPASKNGSGCVDRPAAIRGHGQHKAAVLDQIAERHDQQQAGAIAELRHRHDQSGGLRRQAEIGCDRSDQRLGIIEIGDDQPAGHREQQRNPARDDFQRPRQFSGDRGHEALQSKSVIECDRRRRSTHP